MRVNKTSIIMNIYVNYGQAKSQNKTLKRKEEKNL